MIRVEGQIPLGIDWLDPNEPQAALRTHAIQVSQTMRWVQLDHYIRDMGLRRIDPDPPPDPADEAHIAWRMERLRYSGFRFMGAILLDNSGNPLSDANAMPGLLVVSRPQGECTPQTHQPLKIEEFNIHPWFRGAGLCRLMLQEAARALHPDDPVTLDVALGSPAIDIYRHYTFQKTGRTVEHDVFAVRHIGMETNAIALQRLD